MQGDRYFIALKNIEKLETRHNDFFFKSNSDRRARFSLLPARNIVITYTITIFLQRHLYLEKYLKIFKLEGTIIQNKLISYLLLNNYHFLKIFLIDISNNYRCYFNNKSNFVGQAAQRLFLVFIARQRMHKNNKENVFSVSDNRQF
jgi:hypothetical protein